MRTCTRCSSAAPDDARFCPSCAAPLDAGASADWAAAAHFADPSLGATTARAASIDITRAPASPPPSSRSPSGAGDRTPSAVRFEPGALIAGRYRLVALLGRGGMGEVYRADDLTLDQPVALKFLPEGVAGHPDRLAQFHGELRTARQVSHKNVCRLYDLGEADGRPFITMEYVDGEDLASLLRRIGRVPEDKAVELARQLCAGLAAAHDTGVLHRDLKPANVMIDGDGNVRLTDFGLAVAEGQTDAVSAGTPQYMAPEQLAGLRRGRPSGRRATSRTFARPGRARSSIVPTSRFASRRQLTAASPLRSTSSAGGHGRAARGRSPARRCSSSPGS